MKNPLWECGDYNRNQVHVYPGKKKEKEEETLTICHSF